MSVAVRAVRQRKPFDRAIPMLHRQMFAQAELARVLAAGCWVKKALFSTPKLQAWLDQTTPREWLSCKF